ncbi:unnamed protein product [Cochlearia groenlandica]
MPRSTRHRSSKHKDSRDYSDSEKESVFKERKRQDESSSKVTKDSSSGGDKRKVDSKEYFDSVSGDYYEEYTSSSSKRRKGKVGDSGSDRWNGKEDEKGESSKKTKGSSEKSSRRREEVGEGDEEKTKKSSGKSDGKHRESSSKRESKDFDKEKERDKDRKHKEGRSEKVYDVEDHHKSKSVSDKTESKTQDQLRSPGTENHSEKRSRRKRDDHAVVDKHQDNSDDVGDRDYERERDRNERDRDRARDREYERDRERDRERERDRDRREYEHDRYHERDWDRDRSRDRDRDHDRDRNHDREKDRSREYYHDGKQSKRDRERDNDRDVSRLDDQSGRYKERKEGRKSPEYQDYQDVITGNRSGRAEPDGDMTRAERQPSSLVVQEENGNASDQIIKGVSSREAAELSGGSERATRHKVSEKTSKMEDGDLGEFQAERSPVTKASPRPMVERSPSSMSLERRFNNRSGGRRSLEVEETGHRNNTRDFSAPEDERLQIDGTSQTESSFNNKSNQNNSFFPPRPESRSGISSPRVGPREEDNRANTGGRYKRGTDSMMGRGQGNVWRGVPSWPSPLPNGFIPFQHVPPHGGFQGMMPQFPTPSLFGVRPSMEMNHQGIPYHIPDAERFSGHMRPLGWHNMMDGSGASPMHGFFGDMSNSVFRDESNMYGGSEWDQNRRMHGRGWESSGDEWKNRNGDAGMEASSMAAKDDNSAQVADDESLGGQTSHSDNNRAKSVEVGSNITSPAKELHAGSPKIVTETVAEDPVQEKTDITERYCRHYLSKLDISVELADTELWNSISLLMGQERLTTDDGAAVFVNLKEGGKRVPKTNSTSLTTLSLFPSQNSSLFQIAMDLYKEQRFDLKGLPNVESHRPAQLSPPSLVKVGANDEVIDTTMNENSSVETADVKMADVLDPDTSLKEPQNVSLSHVDAGMEMETEDIGSSSPYPNNSPEALKAVLPDNTEGGEQDDGAGVDQTVEETAPEDDEVPESDPITLTEASPTTVVEALSEDENMKEAEEEKKKEEEEDVVVGDVSNKVMEPLVDESLIHHSPQSTH